MTGAARIHTVGHQTQELRFATAMTGGVSLAIWMGGVAREMNLLQRASDERKGLTSLPPITAAKPAANVQALYLRLLNLVDTTVDADILAGTSAGGINAALLAVARVNDRDLAPLRKMWLDLGALETLLRDPAEDAPPSLLQGDGQLLTGLEDGLGELAFKGSGSDRQLPPTSVRLTTTLIEGEAGRFTDAYGTLVQDVDHHGMFTFDELALAESVGPAMATAGRSTASFPFAFEPGYVAFGEDASGRPAMARYANITRSHWVSDGGLLMNRPIQPLLQEVFDRPADRHVRRVLLYVIPSRGKQPDPRSSPPPATLDKPLSLVDALLGDVKAVMQQSVAADLTAIRAHNDRVDSLCDTRLRMAQLGNRLAKSTPAQPGGDAATRHTPLAGMRLTSEAMFEDYRERQSDWSARPIVAALMREVASTEAKDLPEAWRKELGNGTGIEQRCRAAAATAIAAGWAISGGLKDASAPWWVPLDRFGLAAYDGAKATSIRMMRSAFALADAETSRATLGRRLGVVHEALAREPDAGASPPDRLRRPHVSTLVHEKVAALCQKPATTRALPQVAAELALEYRDKLDAAAGDLRAAWSSLARAICSAEGDLRALLAAAGSQPATPAAGAAAQIRRDRLSRKRAVAELAAYVEFVFCGDADGIAARLFDLHVATRSVLPVGVDVEQPVELVQLSADSRTLLSSRKTAQQKLTGMQLHHFGAFYKSSWRASDWTWGRIDGAGWLVHLLLDPRRIDTVTAPGTGRATGFHSDLATAIGADPTTTEAQAALKELGFLDGGSRPASLPKTALWVAREVQRWIAAEELPVVAQAMLANDEAKADPWAATVLELAASATPPAAAAIPPHVAMGDQLGDCPVPSEKLEQQVGKPLMTRTLTKAAAVTGAMANAGKPPVALKAPLAFLRTVTMAAYRVAWTAKGARPPLLWFGAAAMVLGLVLALYDTSFLGFTGAVLFAIGFTVVAAVTWGWSTKARIGIAAAAVIGGVLALGAKRVAVFGDGTCTKDSCSPDDIGWFGREVLPWLSASIWRVMIPVFGLAVLAAATGAIGARLATPKAEEPHAPGDAAA